MTQQYSTTNIYFAVYWHWKKHSWAKNIFVINRESVQIKTSCDVVQKFCCFFSVGFSFTEFCPIKNLIKVFWTFKSDLNISVCVMFLKDEWNKEVLCYSVIHFFGFGLLEKFYALIIICDYLNIAFWYSYYLCKYFYQRNSDPTIFAWKIISKPEFLLNYF